MLTTYPQYLLAETLDIAIGNRGSTQHVAVSYRLVDERPGHPHSMFGRYDEVSWVVADQIPDGPASSSATAASMNAVSGGLTPPPAKWPQMLSMTRNSAFGICETAHSSSSGGK